jgi:alkanesulfonate monooxygenase SsuD/methylene tetrahydromethanopterin reductase-like flavin-dependent oxidoreductase (luciferase family)
MPWTSLCQPSARAITGSSWPSQTLVGDPYVELALAAAATSAIELGVAVTNTVTRHPSVTAAAIATIHMESHGRAVLGIGRGDSALRFIGQSPASMATLEAGLRDIRAYLHGELVESDGAGARLSWLPADLPAVPIDLAASGPATIALGATFADRLTFNLSADPALIGWAVATARQLGSSPGWIPRASRSAPTSTWPAIPTCQRRSAWSGGAHRSSSGSWLRPWLTGFRYPKWTDPLWPESRTTIDGRRTD